MRFFSTNNRQHEVGLAEAIIKGLAPDQGLYFPIQIPRLREEFIKSLPGKSFKEIGYEVIGNLFSEDLSVQQIKELVDHTLAFDAPLVKVEPDFYSQELFHGPTLAFKDFGARFCSKLMSMLLKNQAQKVRVLVATSGDTGSAVANGFLGVDGVEVIILFPKGKVSKLQEKQFTTLGENIKCLEIDGVFDDCQRLVKQAFLDQELNEKMVLTSANSINIARWIPQALYYFRAYSLLEVYQKKLVVSVPSGNFGNLAAGILAMKMGLPIDQFVASTNLNKIVPDYLNGSVFHPQASVQTISNSMDVGDPSNFPRLLALFNQDDFELRKIVKGYFFDDHQTREAIQKIHKLGYLADPHGAVGYLGLKSFMEENPGFQGIFLETAHPGKFREVVEETLNMKVDLPDRLEKFLKGKKESESMDGDFLSFKNYLKGN
ncbi:threonine synthase [Algoriphagus sediminis]|uniref:Threonine synthase n=1 Tax=Algoriphagus sediminis TaxID=3057113 RepID=A0ABT7YEZ7_9BACT|nr:threonine synthase [Algoriphagus sediminis]MDN3205077.1 threonine synthase [Algoriphagus sediminis]